MSVGACCNWIWDFLSPTFAQCTVTASPSRWWTWSLRRATESVSSWAVPGKVGRGLRGQRPSWRPIVQVKVSHNWAFQVAYFPYLMILIWISCKGTEVPGLDVWAVLNYPAFSPIKYKFPAFLLSRKEPAVRISGLITQVWRKNTDWRQKFWGHFAKIK